MMMTSQLTITSLKRSGILKRSGKWTAFARSMTYLVLASFLFACANDPVHKAAMEQVKKGPVEEGIANLKKSSENNPETVPYRADYLRERDRAVNQLLLEAGRSLGQDKPDEAQTTYQRVLTIDPDNAQAKMGLLEVDRNNKHAGAISKTRDAIERSDYLAARDALQPVLLENPKNVEAMKLKEEIDAARFNGRTSNPLPELGANFKKPVSLQFRDANLKMILEALSKSSGMNILLDKDVKNDLKATIFVKNASVEDVISLILMQNQLEKKVINDTTVYIYPNTPSKVKEFQDLIIRDFHLTNADAKQMLTMLKTVLKANDVFVNEVNNSIVMRDTPDVVELAAKLIAAQDQNEPEVMLEVEVLEVSHNKLMELGIKYPDQVTFSLGAAATAAAAAAGGAGAIAGSAGGLTLRDLKNINDSKINVFSSAGALNLVLDLKKTDGATNILASPRIRVKQNEKAKIHIGDKVPVITNSVTPVSTGTPVVTGSVQYLDVGLKLEVEPEIHMDGEVSIKTALEVSNIASQVVNAASGTIAYQIGTRNVSTVLRLKDGETQVLAGLISANDIESASKIPGLGDLPLIGRLFSSHNTNKTKTEIILSITPHIIRNQHQPDANLSSYWSGTSNAAKSRPITVEKMETFKFDSASGSQSDGLVPVQPAAQRVAPVNPAPPTAVIRPASPANATQPAGQELTPAQSRTRAGTVSRGFSLPRTGSPEVVQPTVIQPPPPAIQQPPMLPSDSPAGLTDATIPVTPPPYTAP